MTHIFNKDILTGRNIKFYLFVFLFFAIVIIFRRPQTIIDAQFWAEDGKLWFMEAYEMGWIKPFFLPRAGYFQTLARLGTVLSLLFPFAIAPLVMNLVALTVQVSPAVFMLTGRMKNSISDDRIRIIIAFFYILLPNSAEIHANLTSAQWYLAVLTFLIIVANKPPTLKWKIFDISIVTLSVLSGPFVIFFLPIVILMWVIDKTKRNKFFIFLCAAASISHTLGMFFIEKSPRLTFFVSYTPELFFSVLNKQVFLATILGSTGYAVVQDVYPMSEIFFLLTTVIGVVLVLYALASGPKNLRYFIFFAGATLLAGMFSPTLELFSQTEAERALAGKHLFNSGTGMRYWMMPIIAYFIILLWAASERRMLIMRIIAIFMLMQIGTGLIKDFRDGKYVDYEFQVYAQKYEEIHAGESLTIPLNPPGWEMTLIKK